MRQISLLALATVALVAVATAQDPPPETRLLDYQEATDWIPETPGTTSGAVGGFINPATWSTLQPGRPEFAFWWNDRSVRSGALDNWGFATSGWLGLGVNSQVFQLGDQTYRATDWQLGISGGDRNSRLGLAYRWKADDAEALGRENAFVAGLLSRPHRFVSLGAVGTWSTESRARYGVFDLGLRPLGNERVTLFGDITYTTLDGWDDGRWGAGVTVVPITGVHLGVTAREETGSGDLRWIGNVGVNLSDLGLHWLPSVDSDGDLQASTFLVRSNPPTRNLVDELWAFDDGERFAVVDLQNRYLTYQRYQLFDERRVAWLDLAAYLDAVAADPSLDGLVLDLFDFTGRPSLIWELRARLEELQERGKEIVILSGRLDIGRLYLASVADHLWIDPEADVVLQGVSSGRTYFHDMLDKLGLGFQELRYFKYKSAAETGSRMSMSEGEREQRQRMVDVIYEEFRRGICTDRRLTTARFDELVDESVGLVPGRAKELGLVDAIGRRAELMEWLRRDRRVTIDAPDLEYRRGSFPEESWSEPPRIAVVYAVGACAMDEGIEGRATARYLNGLVSDPTVEAVVLRADSPGGDPLPSDLVAGAIRRLNEAGKPVIVSQGDVAASGGYWISMDGAEILTTPLTVTGSIGVIGAWIHADEVSEKTGMAYDGVKRGEHADLLRPLRDPFLGIGVPHRALDEEELELAREYILEAYEDFVTQVAAARELSVEHVREVGQGRIWMGGDAIERRLCDRFGGLDAAIAAARERVGLGPDREVELVEYPPRPLIDLAGLLGRGGGPLGFPFGILTPVEQAYARLVAAAPWHAGPDRSAMPGSEAALVEDFDYARWYLESLDGRLGKPRCVLGPEVLPEGWGRPN